MSKFLNNLINGNHKGEPLPTTRRMQLKRILRDHYGLLITVSVFSFISMIPAVVLTIIFGFNQTHAIEADPHNIASIVFSSNLSLCLYLIPCVLFIAIGYAGLFSVLKKLVWDERITIKSYFEGIKENFLRFILIFYFGYIFVFACIISLSYYSYNTSLPQIVRYLLIAVSVVLLVIVLSMCLYMSTMTVRYELKIKDLFKNSFVFTFNKLLINLGFTLLVYGFWILNLFVPGLYQLIVDTCMLLFLISLFNLLLTSYHAYRYDELVNKEMYPEIYKKGLGQQIDLNKEDIHQVNK